MMLRSSNLVRSWILGCSCPRTTNWSPSRRALGHVTQFRNYDCKVFLCGVVYGPALLTSDYVAVLLNACGGRRTARTLGMSRCNLHLAEQNNGHTPRFRLSAVVLVNGTVYRILRIREHQTVELMYASERIGVNC